MKRVVRLAGVELGWKGFCKPMGSQPFVHDHCWLYSSWGRALHQPEPATQAVHILCNWNGDKTKCPRTECPGLKLTRIRVKV